MRWVRHVTRIGTDEKFTQN